ncbi:MAG: hypothetical protein V5A25_13170 [Halovenus sp.]
MPEHFEIGGDSGFFESPLHDGLFGGLAMLFAVLNLYNQSGRILIFPLSVSGGVMVGLGLTFLLRLTGTERRLGNAVDEMGKAVTAVVLFVGTILLGGLFVALGGTSLQASNWLLGVGAAVLLASLGAWAETRLRAFDLFSGG